MRTKAYLCSSTISLLRESSSLMAEKSAARLTTLFWRGSEAEDRRGLNSVLKVKRWWKLLESRLRITSNRICKVYAHCVTLEKTCWWEISTAQTNERQRYTDGFTKFTHDPSQMEKQNGRDGKETNSWVMILGGYYEYREALGPRFFFKYIYSVGFNFAL